MIVFVCNEKDISIHRYIDIMWASVNLTQNIKSLLEKWMTS